MKPTRNPFAAASGGALSVNLVVNRRKEAKRLRVALRRGHLLTLAALALFGVPRALAVNLYWDGSGTGWDVLSSWSTAAGAATPDPLTTVPGIADLVLFNISTVNTAQTVNLNAGQSALGLSFTSTGAVLLEGGGSNRTLTLAGSGITKTGTGTVTIGSVTAGQQVALALSANQTWTNNDNTAAINILNGVAASTATTRTLTLGGTSTAANTLSGIIANNSTGVMSLAKSGAGTWLLSGANTYTGTTSISAGILKLGNASALGTTTGGTTLSGGTLDLNGQSVGAETITLSGTSALVNTSGTAASLSGNISGLQSTSTMGGTGDLTLSGVIASSGTSSSSAWSKVGTGKLTLSGANTFKRALTISAGVVNIQNATALGTTSYGTTVNSGAALEIQGGITVGAEALTLRGTGIGTAGALRNISGTNIYGGRVTLRAATRINSDAGTLTLSNTGTIAGTYALAVGGAGNTTINSIIGISSSPLTKDGTGILTLGGVNTYTGVTTLTDGTLSVATIGNGGVAGNLGTATSAAANLVFDGGTLRYTGANASTDRSFTINSGKVASFEVSANNLTLSGASPASNGGLTKTGAGTLTLTASQLYTGTTTVSAGTLALSGAGAIADASAVNIAAAAVLNISAITASGETIGSLTGVSGSSVVLGAKTLTTGNASDTSFGGVLSGTGGVLTKTGAGTLTLSGSNTHTGGTTISAGAVSVAASSALGLETNVLTIGSGATLKASESFSTSRATTLGGAGAGVGGSIEVATGKILDCTSGSSIGGSGSLIKTGAGTLFLEGTNAFTGGLYIQAGTLAANSQEALGAVPSAGSSSYGLHLYDGATFQIQVGSWATYRQLELVGNLVGSGGVAKVDVTNGFTHQRNGLVTGVGKLDLVGTGTLILTAANTYSGGTLIENGVLQVNNSSGSATGSGAVSVASGGTLSGLPTAPGFPGVSGSVSGTVTLLSGGRLLAGSGTTLTLGGLALSGGALESLQIGSLTSTSLVNITGSNLFTLPSSGTSTLDIVNTGSMGVGTYHLFDYAGSALSDISNLVLANAHSGLFNLSLVNNTGNTSIDLQVDSITLQWLKGNTNTNWSTASNWAGTEPNGVGAEALFLNNNNTAGFGTAEAVTLDGDKTVGALVFQNTATAFTLGSATGKTLTLDEAAGIVTISVLSAPVTANHGVNVPMILADNLTVDIAAGNFGLDLGGAISGSGKTLTKTGTGPLTLSGAAANTYSGLTQVAGGTLNLNKTAGVNAIGSSGLQIDSNTTVVLLASNQIADGATVTVNGAFNLGTLSETIAILAGGGAVTTGSGSVLTLNSATDSTFLGIISGSGGLAKAGSGTLTLNGSNTYTGGTSINAGTLRVGADHDLGGTGAITFGGGTLAFSTGFSSSRNLTLNSGGGTLDNSGSTATLSGVISGSGALTKTGIGTVRLTGANSYTGATTISNGILQISNAAALGVTGAGTTINAGGELEINADGMVLNEAITLHGGSLCNLAGTNTFSGSLTLTANSVLDTDATKLIITSGISQSGGTYGLVKDGPGTVELKGTNTYTGETHVLAGTLSLFNGAAIVDSTAVILHNTAGVTLELHTSETIGSLAGGGTSGGDVNLDSCTLTTGNASDTNFGGIISGSGGALVKTGSGTLTLSGNNSHSGGTTISAGALSVAASSALGLEANNLTIGSGTTLKLSDSFSTSRATTLGGAGGGVGGSFEVAAGKVLTYTSGSVIGGSGSLIKTGAGSLAIGGVDSYTGGTYIQAGTLVVNSGYALGPLPTLGSSNYAVHISDGATIQLATNSWSTNRQLELISGTANVDVTSGISIVRNGAIYGSGAMNSMGAGTLIINNNGSNANTYTGGTIIANGVLQVNNTGGSATGTGAVTVMSGGTLSGLTAQGASTGTTGTISGTVGIQSGGKLLTLSGGTLTLGGLTLDAGSLSTFQLGTLTATSLVAVTGSDLFTLPDAGTSTINIVNTGAMGVGTYSLFNYAGSAFSDISNLVLANPQSGLFNFSLVNNTGNTSIDLSVSAILQQWKKGGTNTNWSTDGNWWVAGGGPNGAGAAAAFINNNGTAGFAATEAVTLDTSKTVGTLAFQNTATAFTLSAPTDQTLTLDNNGVDASIQVFSAPTTANHGISAPIILLDDMTVDIAAGSYGLNLSGDISGDQTVTKTGAGPLTLSGSAANTYSGLTEVAAGTLNLNKTAAIDAISSGGLQINSGATVTWLASNQIADDAGVTVNGTLALGIHSETFAGLAGGGAVTLGSGGVLTLNGATDSTFLGSISGAGSLAKAGAGTLTLNGASSYTGGTTLTGGTLQVGADNNLGGTGAITFDGGTLAFSAGFSSARNLTLSSGGGTLDSSGSGVTLSGVISGSGTLTKNGTGTVTLNTANSYTGATVINNGILQIGNAAALGTSGAGTTIHAGGELELNGSGLTLNEAITLNGGELCNCIGTNT